MLQNLLDYQAEIQNPSHSEADTRPEFLRVGQLLYQVREAFGTKDLDNVIQDTGLKRKGRYWLAIYEFQVAHKLDVGLLTEVGWTKIKLLLENSELEGTKSQIIKTLKNAVGFTVHELEDAIRREAPTTSFIAALPSSDMSTLRSALESFGLKYGPGGRGMLNAPLALMNLVRYSLKCLAADKEVMSTHL